MIFLYIYICQYMSFLSKLIYFNRISWSGWLFIINIQCKGYPKRFNWHEMLTPRCTTDRLTTSDYCTALAWWGVSRCPLYTGHCILCIRIFLRWLMTAINTVSHESRDIQRPSPRHAHRPFHLILIRRPLRAAPTPVNKYTS